jgi:hypothetical protein
MAPLHGLVTTCASASRCDFLFQTTAGTGWANASPPSISLRLPGEAATSTSLSYSTYTASLTGYYTYWTVGNFLGTDVNTGKVVYGTTNTNYTITCHGHSGRGGGCTYTYTTDNGTIVVYFTQAEATATTVTCTPSTIASGASTVCTATVNDTANASARPSGVVTFSGSYGSNAGFSNGGSCTLASGACSVSYTAPDEQLGTVAVTASFAGTPSYYASSGRTSVYVTSSDSGGGSSFSTIRFGESGLPNGTDWSVTFGGLLLSSSNASLPFEVQNGTYSFLVGAVPGYLVSPRTGNVTVVGSDVDVNVSFAQVTYSVTFTETGIPYTTLARHGWTVALNGIVGRSTTPTIAFTGFPNGTYPVLVSGPSGYVSNGTGGLTVHGATNVSVAFEKRKSVTLALIERGIPSGRSWCVSLDSYQECATTKSEKFLNLTPGLYSYTVVLPSHNVSLTLGKTPEPLSGTLDLAKNEKLTLTYLYTYGTKFTETGLTSGVWSVSVKGVMVTAAVGSPISFQLGNGTYGYKLSKETGFTSAGSPRPAVVSGASVNVSVTFKAGPTQAPIAPALSLGFAGSVPILVGIGLSPRNRM